MSEIVAGTETSTAVHTDNADLLERLASAPHLSLDSQERRDWLASQPSGEAPSVD